MQRRHLLRRQWVQREVHPQPSPAPISVAPEPLRGTRRPDVDVLLPAVRQWAIPRSTQRGQHGGQVRTSNLISCASRLQAPVVSSIPSARAPKLA